MQGGAPPCDPALLLKPKVGKSLREVPFLPDPPKRLLQRALKYKYLSADFYVGARSGKSWTTIKSNTWNKLIY